MKENVKEREIKAKTWNRRNLSRIYSWYPTLVSLAQYTYLHYATSVFSKRRYFFNKRYIAIHIKCTLTNTFIMFIANIVRLHEIRIFIFVENLHKTILERSKLQTFLYNSSQTIGQPSTEPLKGTKLKSMSGLRRKSGHVLVCGASWSLRRGQERWLHSRTRNTVIWH